MSLADIDWWRPDGEETSRAFCSGGEKLYRDGKEKEVNRYERVVRARGDGTTNEPFFLKAVAVSVNMIKNKGDKIVGRKFWEKHSSFIIR